MNPDAALLWQRPRWKLAALLACLGMLGAFAMVKFMRYDNDIYVQVGLVMLIGLAAKNAILIVEFAKAEYEKGRPLVDSAIDCQRAREVVLSDRGGGAERERGLVVPNRVDGLRAAHERIS